MRDYLLFIDTEGTSWPKHWNAPYSKENKWPHCIQISWLICSKNGEEIKRENHYINDDFKIDKRSFKIHGITKDFLSVHGESRHVVMNILSNDILKYQPMMVGHFMELDMHMIGADFYRAKIDNPTTGMPFFCTMESSKEYAATVGRRYLRLNELHAMLFNEMQPDQHNALSDASASAACFFELMKRGEIDDAKISAQQVKDQRRKEVGPVYVFAILGIVLIIITIIVLVIYLSWIH